MSFFKKYNGTTHVGLARLETLIWTLVYGGLLTLVLGLFMPPDQEDLGLQLMIGGAIVASIGAGLIYYRSRLHETG